MTKEERAKEFVSKIASGTSQEMDYYANILVEFVNETTKELQEDLKHKKIAIQNRKARIKDLEKQVEKMKCCGNCKHRYFIGDELECHLLDNGINCDNEDKWEMKE